MFLHLRLYESSESAKLCLSRPHVVPHWRAVWVAIRLSFFYSLGLSQRGSDWMSLLSSDIASFQFPNGTAFCTAFVVSNLNSYWCPYLHSVGRALYDSIQSSYWFSNTFTQWLSQLVSVREAHCHSIPSPQ